MELKRFFGKAAGVAVLSAAGLLFTQGTARAETLADALASAYNTSGLLEQNRALLRAADENVPQALSALRPIISWSASASRTFGETASATSGYALVGTESGSASLSLSAQILLYDGGASRIGVEIAKESVLATRQSLVAVEQQILLRAASAYLEVLRAQAFLDLRQNNLRLLTQELRAAKDRFEVGEVTRTDVSLAEARLAASRSNLATAQGTLAQARLEYLTAVGHEPGSLSPVRALTGLPATADAAAALALRQHPALLQARYQVNVAELRIAVADAALSPSVSLSGSLSLSRNFYNDGRSQTGTISLGASQPIYSGGSLSSLQRQAHQNRDAARSGLHVTAGDIRQNVGNAIATRQLLRASYESSQQQVRAAQLAFQGVREEATLGARTTLDVLNAEQELLDARANLISSEIDQLVAGYSLLSAMGELTAQKLKLKVRTYDPAGYYNMVKDGPAGLSKQGRQLDRVLRGLQKE
ncbi:TolC family outer membrane protein [Pseudooceanicola sp. C21-150M6]|uniref:TolC family outer membrane protein n=1 Tax=Pseudooceanicola sp. C21-150M6 TaxID=3434355 RepID=UPI003D7F93C1